MKTILINIIEYFIHFKLGVVCFCRCEDGIVIENRPNIIYREAFVLDDIKNLNFDYNIEMYENRFDLGHVFCYLLGIDNQILSYGWRNKTGFHYISELRFKFKKDNLEVFYDFHTFSSFRGKGLYPYLLNRMHEQNNTLKFIYALKTNTSSLKGIKKAHFKEIGTIKWHNKMNLNRLIDNYINRPD